MSIGVDFQSANTAMIDGGNLLAAMQPQEPPTSTTKTLGSRFSACRGDQRIADT
jgi:hypothetical protein